MIHVQFKVVSANDKIDINLKIKKNLRTMTQLDFTNTSMEAVSQYKAHLTDLTAEAAAVRLADCDRVSDCDRLADCDLFPD